MKKINIYILKTFLKYLLIVQFGVLVLSLISSTLGQSQSLAGYSYTFFQFALTQMCWVVINNNLSMPLTTTLAAIITILLLMRSNELLAYITLGGKVISIAIPLVAVSTIVMIFMLVLEYVAVPKARIYRTQISDEIKGITNKQNAGYTNMWLMDGSSKIVYIELCDLVLNELRGVKEYNIDQDKQISSVVTIDHVKKDNNEWYAIQREYTDLTANPPTTMLLEDSYVRSNLYDDLFKVSNDYPKYLSPTELLTLANVMQSRGLNINNYMMLLYSKYANIISVLVLILLTFPLVINFSRNYSIIKNVSIAFSMGLLFWIFKSLTSSLGDTGALSPFMANFLPIIVASIVTVIIMMYRQTAR